MMTDPIPSQADELPELPDLRFGLSRAIQLHSEDFRVRWPQVALDLDLIEDENLLPWGHCLAFYRAYEAALERAARQVRADKVWVRYYPSAKYMVLQIKDTGEKQAAPVDVEVLQACVKEIGGEVQAKPQAGQETVVIIKVPFAA
jgi:signal transduction histidine kinase